MNTHYLIDFENVHDDWPKAVPNLQETDVVYILYTSNARKISLDTIENLYAGLKVIKVAAGKQSLDMHLVSYLGWLINKYGKDASYVVVSGDNGFDGVIRFWGNRGFNVKRRILPRNGRTLPSEDQEKAMPTEVSPADAPPEKIQEPAQEAPAAVGPAESAPQPEEKNPAEGENPKPQEPAASAPAEKRRKNYRTGRRPQTKKQPELPKDPEEAAQPPEQASEPVPANSVKLDHSKARMDLNNKITVILAKAADVVDPKQIGEITSLVMKQADKENRRGVIYKAMLQKYGQKTGLSYYRLIKDTL